MAAVFVHVSDIHFGQERDFKVFVHNDVKDRVLADAAQMVSETAEGKATGILVTGDIAYSGKQDEYHDAAVWLDALAAKIGCEKTNAHVVPGNHDIDRDLVSDGVQYLLTKALNGGEAALDKIIRDDVDRESIYRRFGAYRPFAEGYDCTLDKEGTLKGKAPIELAPGRSIRFVGFNTALLCSKDENEEGRLLLGARQRVLPVNSGEEIVVLAHHPLNWLQDSDDALRYLRNRARVFISGHEHKPRVNVDPVRPGCDLLMVASGAMVPPTATKDYNFTYNILTFDWDTKDDALLVTVRPREWHDDYKDFKDATYQLQDKGPTFKLACPAYAAKAAAAPPPAASATAGATTPAPAPEVSVSDDDDDYAMLLLRYFRDLLPGQRIVVLVKLKALPDNWSDPLNQAMERQIVDGLVAKGRMNDLQQAMDDLAKEKNG
jgi:3',5'-cyclic AMP phosphodiesterase CpdA